MVHKSGTELDDTSSRGPPYTPSQTSASRLAEVLVVEDNAADAYLFRHAAKEINTRVNLNVVPDGDVALDYLHGRGSYAEAGRPDLIVLDWNLPGKSGRDVLADIKADSRLSDIPVIVFTISRHMGDICESYRLHANSYIVKPVDYHQFLKVVQSIDAYWLTVVALPPKHSGDGGDVRQEELIGVLVVDDDFTVGTMLQLGLRRHGFNVWLASNFEQALSLYEQHGKSVKLALLDVCMPEGTGPQLMAALQKTNPDVRVCFMSGDPGHYTKESLSELGAKAFFRKPFSLLEVANRLTELARE